MDAHLEFDETKLLAARAKHEAWLSRQNGFAGSGLGVGRNGQVCLKIYTNKMPEETRQNVGAVLASVPFEFEELGDIHAL
jgi:hypothetical protein